MGVRFAPPSPRILLCKKAAHSADSSYGVYPSVLKPSIIYELGKQSEAYINEYVMPPISSGFSGRLRKLIKKFIKFHPSLGGLLIIAKKEL